MLSSRILALVAGAGLVAIAVPASAQGLSQFGNWGEAPERNSTPSYLGAAPLAKSVDLAQGGGRPSISPRTPQTTSFPNGMQAGSIVIDTAGRKLYYTLSGSSAYVYPIAVGKEGFTWTGVERVSRIEDWPDWIPPAEMRQRKPGLPVRMTGGLRNPLGAKAIYLGNTLYRIHGTNDSKSIGSASSSGCFRMHNDHVVHLADHVNASTLVYVMRRLPKSGVIMPPATYQQVKKSTEPSTTAPPANAPSADGSAQSPAPAPAQPQAPEAAPQPPAGSAPATDQPAAGQGI
ncbi:L,D-transpeptidase [Hyphomicrobium sp.]|uniref:L,D-transpeptidase n=1 Tax=Hyphomicrobium sp. TaxID=82 RepID=UPI002E35931F|nr:L,D-transpeptidase [Hyphomicrobium sp.]HEX2842023.1 L,D-transpeptidase [Hyphomicrobium sp.]